MFNRNSFAAAALFALSSSVQAFQADDIPFLRDIDLGHNPSDHWAVIIAGSKSFWNYRHQADAAHAYQVLTKNGIPEDQIIYMAYDDVPYDDANPFPGELYNKKDGENVYEHSKIDYTGDSVTADNFYNVLKGDSHASLGKPVLKSDKNSKVFVFYSDHGSPGLLAMPTGRYVFADELQETIDYMEKNEMYNEMVFYIEACESGSMFPKLRDDQHVYAVTASNATQSSYAAYCTPDNTINGTSMVTCLGDLFSVTWMEDDEQRDPDSETISTQFDLLKERTKLSPVQEFGEQDIKNDIVGMYQGTLKDNMAKMTFKDRSYSQSTWQDSAIVDSRDAKLAYYETLSQSNDADSNVYAALEAEMKHRKDTDSIFATAFDHHDTENLVVVPTDFDCLRDMIDIYEHFCQPFEDYSLKYVKNLVNSCETESFSHRLDTKKRIISACEEHKTSQSRFDQ